MLKQLIQAITSPKTSLILIGMLFSLPFIVAYHDIPIATFYGEWLTAVLGLAALLRLLNNYNLQSMQLPQISLIFLGLILICNLQLISGLKFSSQYTLLIQLYMIWAFLLAILGQHLRQVFGWKKVINILAIALVSAGAINAAFVAMQILQQYGIDMPIPKLQSYGMLAQSNNFADFISLSLVSLLYLHTKQRINIQTLAISLVLGLLLLSLSGSRSTVLYLLLIILLSFILHLKFKHQKEDIQLSKQLLKISLLLFPLFALTQILISALLPDMMVHTPASRAMETIGTHSASLRWQFWQTSLNIFSQHPWLGIGAGQMRWHTFLLVNNPAVNPAQIFFEHAHNLFLHLLAEMGIFGGTIVVVGLLSWARGFLKSRIWNLETWWLLSLLGIITIHNMLEYPLWYAYFLGIFAFLLGAGDIRTYDLGRLSNSVQRLINICLIGIILYGSQQLYLMYTAYQKLEHHIAIASQADMSAAQKQALVEDMLWINENTLLAPYAELVLATYISPNIKQADIQIKFVESALKFIPLRKPALNYVLLLEMHHQHIEAIQHLERIWLISGKNLQDDIQQLSIEHQTILQKLLTEMKM